MIKKGSVIQANEKSGEWCGCLLIVDEIKKNGVMASIKIPYKGTAYTMLEKNQYDYIGEAALAPKEGE